MNNTKCLFLFDTSSHFNRSYRGMKDRLSDKDRDEDIPSWAVGSALRMVYREMAEAINGGLPCTHVLCVMDHEGENFRHRMYQEYKANRPPKDDLFYQQKTLLEEAVKYTKMPYVKVPDVESDDVIGTVATVCSSLGIKVVIFTKDKDLYQLVDDNVSIFIPSETKWVSGRSEIVKNFRVLDREGVKSEKGVYPEHIRDFLTLDGDVADNIIGVKGAGSKSIPQILEIASLDDLIENPDILLSSNIRTRKVIVDYINNNKDKILLMRDVATLKVDVHVGQNFRDWRKPMDGLSVGKAILKAKNSTRIKSV
ncbi:5'-3' exonuclease [Photobacterium kishitanii]|uniref:5'-3' exonuclease domain-containing protein n=1 Tax=Photobacterium kishitanii TaxID=318456 RepID=A0A2T3KM54_9GAMM|nr:5'-3' exonuclease H3TH domain-containing protein [Photobacterium kishitanii]PSV00876.1 hypothetical protein C9J27_02285 [Photobacterium kishitanii]